MISTEDIKIIKACMSDDRQAQKQLYDKYYGLLMSVCLRYAPCRDDAVEILNTGFLKIFKNLKKYKSNKGSLKSWMYKIMIHTAIDWTRKEKRHQHEEPSAANELYSTNADGISNLAVEEILNLVQQLSPMYRLVFNLYVIEGYTHKEISKQLNISEGTSKSNLSKARRNLQIMYESQIEVQKNVKHE